jgi:hypothetical protein
MDHGVDGVADGGQNLPQDVATRWNSTFNMLDFALKYRVAIDGITDKHRLGLSSYGLDDHEWVLLEQLRDILKVCCVCSTYDQSIHTLITCSPDPEGCNTLFLAVVAQSRQCHPSRELYRGAIHHQYVEEAGPQSCNTRCAQPRQKDNQPLLFSYGLIRVVSDCYGFIISYVQSMY